MRRLTVLLSLIFVSIIKLEGQSTQLATEEELMTWIKADKEKMRAKTDELVYLVLIKVRDENKSAFETWIYDILYKALYSSENPMKKAQLKATRWLTPLQMKDNIWTYCWIMDPGIPKTEYDILKFLQQEYGKEAGLVYYEEFQELVTEEPFAFRQTHY